MKLTVEDKLLSCEAPVRVVPGKRWVMPAEWDGRSVFVKFYHERYKADKEARGIALLKKAGIKCPSILYTGKAPACTLEGKAYAKGKLAILITETVAHDGDVLSLMNSWGQQQQEAFFIKYEALVMQMIQSRVIHMDLHLGNVLLQGNELITLDGDAVWPASDDQELHEFYSLCLAQFGYHYYKYFPRLSTYQGIDRTLLHQLIRQKLFKKQQKLSEKVRRDCTLVSAKKQCGRQTYVARDYLDNPCLKRVLKTLKQPENSPNYKMIKNGNTCFVYFTEQDGTALVVKRYNTRPFPKRITDLFREGRAVHNWSAAHVLLDMGIRTPKPVAAIVTREGTRRLDYYICELSPGEALLDAVNKAEGEQKRQIDEAVEELFATMEAGWWTHGDCKALNFLWHDETGLTVIDLDALRFHEKEGSYENWHEKDIKRFEKNWLQYK